MTFEASQPVPGVRLITESMPHVRSACIGLWVDCGSIDEGDELGGASHLLEHLLFKGTSKRSAKQIADVIDAVGGELNAFSAKEYTCYYARVLDTDAALAADVLLDMFSGAALKDEDLNSERKVVLEEIHMTADTPDDWVHDLFYGQAWPAHPLGRPIIGTAESVSAMDRRSLADFYGEGYTLSRLVVAAAGNLTHAALQDQIRTSFKDGGPAFLRPPAEVPQFVAGDTYVYKETEQSHIVWGSTCPARNDPDRYALAVLNALYGGSMSSRLFQAIRENRGLAYSVFSGYQAYEATGLFTVYMGIQDQAANEALKIVRDEARSMAAGDVTNEELERARGHVKGGIVLSLDDPGGRMSRLGKAELTGEPIKSVEEILARVESVTTQDVARVASRVFNEDGFVLATVGRVASGALTGHTDRL